MLSWRSAARAAGAMAPRINMKRAMCGNRVMNNLKASGAAGSDKGPGRCFAARLAWHLNDDRCVCGKGSLQCELQFSRVARPYADGAKALGEPHKVRIHEGLADKMPAE